MKAQKWEIKECTFVTFAVVWVVAPVFCGSYAE